LILQTIHHLFFLFVRAETIKVFAQALELPRHSSMVLDALESISYRLIKVSKLEVELEIREFGLEKLNLPRIVLNFTKVGTHAI